MNKAVKWIKTNWADPVWSKVFAGIILATLTGIGTLLFALVKQVPIRDLYLTSISAYIRINYFTLFIIAIVISAIVIPAIMSDILRDRLKDIILRKRGMKELLNDKNIEAIFPGKWLNQYTFGNGNVGNEILEIKNGNEYHALGRHLFNIDSVEIDEKSGIIKFRKNGVDGDSRKAVNTLKIINKRCYEGEEEHGTKIVYTRID